MAKSRVKDEILALLRRNGGSVRATAVYRHGGIQSKSQLDAVLATELAGLVIVASGQNKATKRPLKLLRLTAAGWQRSGGLDDRGWPLQGIQLDLRTLLQQLENLAQTDVVAARVLTAVRDYVGVVEELNSPPAFDTVAEDLAYLWRHGVSHDIRIRARRALKQFKPALLGQYRDLRYTDPGDTKSVEPVKPKRKRPITARQWASWDRFLASHRDELPAPRPLPAPQTIAADQNVRVGCVGA